MVDREPDDLPLDELRRAWRGLASPLPAEELDDCDAGTRASVEWMQAAWSSLEVPEPRVPHSRPQLAPQFAWQRSPRRALESALPYAAAAALLVTLWFAGSEQSLQRPEQVARSQTEAPLNPSDYEGPQLAALSSDHLELRSGPVRLILLKDQRTP